MSNRTNRTHRSRPCPPHLENVLHRMSHPKTAKDVDLLVSWMLPPCDSILTFAVFVPYIKQVRLFKDAAVAALTVNDKLALKSAYDNFLDVGYAAGIECWKKHTEALRAMPYHEYLQTEHWQAVRQKALKRARNRCQLCNNDWRLNVHHRTYERLGQERLHDVTVLCRECHAKFHNKLPAEPT